MIKLSTQDISVTLNSFKILESINVEVGKHEFVGLIGPNGSGKSTLLKTIYGYLRPDAGYISLENKSLFQLSSKELAKKMGVVRQEGPLEFDFTVYEIVEMGRLPHKSIFERDTKKDKEIINQALQTVGMDKFKSRNYSTLSGGEKQRVLIARALAQQAKFLILDEPTNHLDIHYQLQIMDMVKGLNITVIAALHDLNIAATYCDRIYVINQGKIVASGTPEFIIEPNLISQVFGVKSHIIPHPITQKPCIIFCS